MTGGVCEGVCGRWSGIYTTMYSESFPSRGLPLTITTNAGNAVTVLATIRGRRTAPPVPAPITLNRRATALHVPTSLSGMQFAKTNLSSDCIKNISTICAARNIERRSGSKHMDEHDRGQLVEVRPHSLAAQVHSRTGRAKRKLCRA